MFKKIYIAFISITAVMIALFAGKYFSQIGVNGWYVAASKPLLTPPNYVFPIVWGFLYILQAWAFYRILYYNKGGDAASLMIIQLSLQVMWCLTFFALESAIMGLVVLIMLLITAFILIKMLKNRDILSARLLYPYFVWLLFAGYLNLSFVW